MNSLLECAYLYPAGYRARGRERQRRRQSVLNVKKRKKGKQAAHHKRHAKNYPNRSGRVQSTVKSPVRGRRSIGSYALAMLPRFG